MLCSMAYSEKLYQIESSICKEKKVTMWDARIVKADFLTFAHCWLNSPKPANSTTHLSLSVQKHGFVSGFISSQCQITQWAVSTAAKKPFNEENNRARISEISRAGAFETYYIGKSWEHWWKQHQVGVIEYGICLHIGLQPPNPQLQTRDPSANALSDHQIGAALTDLQFLKTHTIFCKIITCEILCVLFESRSSYELKATKLISQFIHFLYFFVCHNLQLINEITTYYKKNYIECFNNKKSIKL